MKSGSVTPTLSGKLAESFMRFQRERRPARVLNLPPEILGIIYSYLDDEDKTPATVCNLALVCKCFMHFFASDRVWDNMKNRYLHSYVLLQNSVTCNIWESDSINNWYQSLESPNILPSEIWAHRHLLLKVLSGVKVLCAPSKIDFEPYANDFLVVTCFFHKMADGDCFSYISEARRDNETLSLEAIDRFPNAIKFCTPKLLNDRDFIKKAVNTNGKCLKYLGDYCADPELVLAASRTSIDVLDHAKGQAKDDMEKIYKHLAKKNSLFSADKGNTQPGQPSFGARPLFAQMSSELPINFFGHRPPPP